MLVQEIFNCFGGSILFRIGREVSLEEICSLVVGTLVKQFLQRVKLSLQE